MSEEATVSAGQNAEALRKQIAQLQTELQAERSRGLLRRLFGLCPWTAETIEQTLERMRGVIATALIRTLVIIVGATFWYVLVLVE